ncbi:ATP-binding protein [Bacillus sp. Marseille-Q1617]|uniref:ATP-binding protein n=1 Tax=Bacillus sp. Marseille-Q1617 TaxID=2736887 RepID=UPI00158DE93A|nr:ATP-binding protein [Bacillus sp. Marseille-Q1617]
MSDEAQIKRRLLHDHIQQKLLSNEITFTNHADCIFVLDDQGHFMYLNELVKPELGYPHSELLHTNFLHYIAHKDIDNAKSALSAIRNGGIRNVDLRIVDSNDKQIDTNMTFLAIEHNGEVIGMYGFLKNLTAEKLNDKNLEYSGELYRRIVEFSPDTVLISKKDICQYINETGVKLLKAESKSQIMNRSILEFVHHTDRETLEERLTKLSKGETVLPKSYKLVCLDGSSIEVEIKAIPTYFNHEKAFHIIIRDLSEQKLTQELMLKSEKLSVAGQLAAGIAHEIRNPITSIKGFLQLMESDLPQKKGYFEVISSEMTRIESILNEMLALAKPKDADMKEVNLIDLVNQVVTLINADAIMKNIEISYRFNSRPCSITCDENQIKQVFINFIKNAIEAMSFGGKVTIEIERCSQDMVIRFIDEGEGIPEEIAGRIGEPFFTTKSDGTGLGIMVSKQIIENHFGKMNISSDSNGTSVEVLLPIAVHS